MKALFKKGYLAAMVVAVVACEATDDPRTHSTQSALSLDQRYIVTFAAGQASGRAAVAAAGGNIVLGLDQRNAVAARLPGNALQALAANPKIRSIEVDQRRYVVGESVPYGYTLVQADQVPAAPAAGDDGRIGVCIIDSGLYADHDDLSSAWVTGTSDPSTGNWYQDFCGHGTHVAGTITAVAGNAIGVVGLAPDAVSLHIVKVFGDDCSWTYSSTLVAALDECVAQGAQVVSMSLGGSFKSRFEELAFADAYANSGVLSIAAAGNDGNTRKSYPASYDSVISVAAVDGDKTIASFSQRNSQVELSAPGVEVLSTVPYVDQLTVDGQTYLANAIEFAAAGTASGLLVDGGLCTTVGSWTGNVVLCERGQLSFFDKVTNVADGGGVAAVIYNNEPGNFSGTLGEGNTSTIPAISLSQEDGQVLTAGHLGANALVESGPGSGYAFWDGTSMATPHVSAVAALLWSQDGAWTNQQIRDALTATAEELGEPGRDNAYGFGLVQAKAALDWLLAGPPSCTPTESPEVSCSDTTDNDCDGLVDGDDPDCSGPDCSADGVCNPDCAPQADPDCSTTSDCGNGVCNDGESCDGRSSTVACPEDCPGLLTGRPSGRFCHVGGICEGPGCP